VLRVIEYGAAIDFWRKLLESHQRRSANSPLPKSRID
jgi:hypothetical protein